MWGKRKWRWKREGNEKETKKEKIIYSQMKSLNIISENGGGLLK